MTLSAPPDTAREKTKAEAPAAQDKFPEAYAPFLPVIEHLSDPLKSILRGHLLSLEPIFPALQRRDHNRIGDFEGVGGLTQHGDMSRILQSELLLRTEAPLEFLRRIAEHETLYMETEHSDPGTKTVYRLILSVGPNMLGHGRLIALASLIFLARLAHVRKTELYWCMLPAPSNAHWFTGISVNSVKRFLKFGSYAEAAAEDIAAASDIWDDVFAPDRPKDTEYQDWFIGAQNQTGPVHSTSETHTPFKDIPNTMILSMLPPPKEGPREARLELKRGGLSLRRLSLSFPEDVVCVSALNRPFRPVAKPKSPGQTGVGLPALTGWEQRYLMSPSPNQHIIRFEHSERGLLFLETKPDNTVRTAHFLPLPKQLELAGVHIKSDGQRVTILAQSTHQKSESMIYNSFQFGEPKIQKPRIKDITSAHLFSKQPSYAIPVLRPKNGAQCYTSMGQPFDFFVTENEPPKVNIRYKERRILFAYGNHKILHFDPKGKTQPEVDQESPHFEGPSVNVVKGMTRSVAAYPVEPDLTFNRLRGMVYSRSSRGLAYSVYPGVWRVLERAANSFAYNFSDISITLPLYETILSSHSARSGTRLMTYSDARFGGDGVLRSITVWDDQIIEKETLYKFGQSAENLTGLTTQADGTIRGIMLGSQGDPAALVVLKKPKGRFVKTVIQLDVVLENAAKVSARKVFG